VVLAFDTFEQVHNDPLVYWLFDDSINGLQMPGLVCLIGSRPPEKENTSSIENLTKIDFIERIQLHGFSKEEALEFYCENSDIDADKLNTALKSFIHNMVEKTFGNPFLLELFFDQFREFDLNTNDYNISNITLVELEKLIAEDILRRHVTFGFFDLQRRSLDIAAFNTLLCMSYLIRRFDDEVLMWIIKRGFIRLDDKNNEGEKVKDILDMLSNFFFVKVSKKSGYILLYVFIIATLSSNLSFVVQEFLLITQ